MSHYKLPNRTHPKAAIMMVSMELAGWQNKL